jgi:putative tryptophan/tyrosine transport system substrate-binding protein
MRRVLFLPSFDVAELLMLATSVLHRLGFLYPVRLEPPDAVAAFFDELKRAGFIKGKNLTIKFLAFAHPERMSEYAAELVKDSPDLILTGGPAAGAVYEVTKTIPILGLDVDLVGLGLVNSMARPNGNVTGVAFLSNELDGKRQEILIEAVPGIRQMAALADAKQRDNRLDVLQEAARAPNIELSIYRIASGQEIAAALDAAKASGAEALNVLSSAMFFGFRRIIIERTLALRLPAHAKTCHRGWSTRGSVAVIRPGVSWLGFCPSSGARCSRRSL